MFSSGGSSRKPLLRSNSGSERPSMRNWPLFLFLFGLVFFFYIFYIYQAQSTEMSVLREQLDSQLLLVKNIKNQLIDAKAEAEQLRSSEKSAKSEKDSFSTKFDECTASLRTSKLKADNVEMEKTKLEDSLKDKDTHIEELRKNVAEVERNSSSLQTLYTAQEQLVVQLNQTNIILQEELAALKGEQKLAVALKQVGGETQASTVTSTAAPKVAAGEGQPLSLSPVGGDADRADEPLSAQRAQTAPSPAPANRDAGDTAVDAEKPADQLAKADEASEQKRQNDEVPQLPQPGERVRLEERQQKDQGEENRPIVQGGDYDDKPDRSTRDKDQQFDGREV